LKARTLERVYGLWPTCEDLRFGQDLGFVDSSYQDIDTDARVENDVVDLRVLTDGHESPRARGIFDWRLFEQRTGKHRGAKALQELCELFRIAILSDGHTNAIQRE
jgi:hypothetical protein